MVAKGALVTKTALTPPEQGPYFEALTMAPATGIEPATWQPLPYLVKTLLQQFDSIRLSQCTLPSLRTTFLTRI